MHDEFPSILMPVPTEYLHGALVIIVSRIWTQCMIQFQSLKTHVVWLNLHLTAYFCLCISRFIAANILYRCWLLTVELVKRCGHNFPNVNQNESTIVSYHFHLSVYVQIHPSPFSRNVRMLPLVNHLLHINVFMNKRNKCAQQIKEK